MNRTKKFFYNSTTSLIYQLATMIVGFIVPSLMLRYYGSEINGLVSSINQFITYFALVEAGLASASVYALYRPLAEKNYDEINGVVSASKKFYTQSGWIFVALVLGLACIYPVFIKTDYLHPVQVGLLCIVLSGTTVLNFFAMAKYRVLYTADQRNYILNILNLVSLVVNTVIIVTLTLEGADIVVLRAVALISVVIPPAFLTFYTKKAYPYVNYKAAPRKEAINKRWDALILQLLGTAHTSAPVLITTFFCSLKEVSVYTIFNMVVMSIQQLMGVFSNGVAASFGELLARKEYKTFQKVYSEYEYLSYFLLGVGLSCTMVLLLPFVQIYTAGVTDCNYNRPLIAFLFVVNAIFYGIKNPQGTLINSAGLFKETKMQTLTQALIAIVGGIILAKPLGLAGVLSARILSNIYRDFDLLIYMPRKIGYISMRKSFVRAGLLLLECAVICIPFVFISLEPTSYLEWVAIGCVVFIYSILVVCGFGVLFDREDLKALRSRGMSIVFARRGKKNA